MTRSLHLRHVIGIGHVLGFAGFALALTATTTASAQDGTAPAGSAAPTTAPTETTAPATTPAEDEEAKKKKAAEEEEAKKKAAAEGTNSPKATEAPANKATAGAPTTAATPDGTGGGNSTTITLSSGNPKKDEPSTGGTKSEAAPPVPWYRGSLMIFDQSMTTNTFKKDSQLSYQPVYEWWISPRVNYNFSKSLRVTLRQDVFKEWTNQGETTERGEWRYTDTWLSLAYRPSELLAKVSKNLSGGVGLQFRPGISKESRIAGQYFAAGPVVNLSYNIELGGEKAKFFKAMHVSSAAIYTYGVSRCNVACAAESSEFSQRRQNSEGQILDDKQVRSASMPGNQLVYTANIGLDIIEHLDFSASMIWISQWAKGTSDATFQGNDIGRSSDDTRLRQFSWFFTQFSYGVTKEFTVAAGYWNLNSTLNAQSTGYRNPFWSPDARIFIDVYFHLDAIYDKLTGGDAKKSTGPGGGGSRVF